ncbi:g7769 [Coccomyxa elongata]
MRNDFVSVAPGGNSLWVGQTNTRRVTTSSEAVQNAVFQIRATSVGGAYTTVTFDAGTNNPAQIVAQLNAKASGGSPHFFWALDGTGRLQSWYGTVNDPASGSTVDFMFVNPGGNTPTYAGDLMGYGSATVSSYGTSVTSRLSPYPLFTAPGPLTYSLSTALTIPTGQPSAQDVVNSLNAQISPGSGSPPFVFALDGSVPNGGKIKYVDNTGAAYPLDLDFRDPSTASTAKFFGYSTAFQFGSIQTPNVLAANSAPAVVNITSSIPTSHYVIQNGQLSVSPITCSMPVVVPAGYNIVYSDLDGANATFEKNQDRLVNLNFSVRDQQGNKLVPGTDWTMVITIEILEDIGNESTALLAEANSLTKQQLELMRTQLIGVDVDAIAAQQANMKRRRQLPTF